MHSGQLLTRGSFLVYGLLTACGPSLRRLDAADVYTGSQVELRVVRNRENLPFHFSGEVAVVQCRSLTTHNESASRSTDAGWVPLGRVHATGSRSARALVERSRKDYKVIADRIVVWTGVALNVSYDSCGHFMTWDPTTLPSDMVQPVEKPTYCAPVGLADCRYYDFQDDRQPLYTEIEATPQGHISFTVKSSALKDTQIQVTSSDSGRSWFVVPVRSVLR